MTSLNKCLRFAFLYRRTVASFWISKYDKQIKKHLGIHSDQPRKDLLLLCKVFVAQLYFLFGYRLLSINRQIKYVFGDVR